MSQADDVDAGTVDPRRVDAVILVGGKGTRLRPLTLSAPKPMLPTAGVPFLTHLLSRIAAAGIEHVVLGTSYRAETFEEEFGDGSKLGLQIDYVVEKEPLGTGGGIANVAPKLRNDTVMVLNGDVLSGADLGSMLEAHRERDADVTLHLVRVSDPRAFGSVPTDADGNVLAFLEKTEDPPTDQINAGTYIFKRSIIDQIPRGREVSVEREVFPALLSGGAKVCGYVDMSYWRDMGTPEDFVRGSADLVRGIAPSPALTGQRGESLVHDGASVAPGALLYGGTVVGRGAEIGAGVRLDGAVVFDGARIEPGAVVERSIIGFGSRIGPRALIRDGVIGDGADIGARCELLRGARVWPGVLIPDCGIRYSSDI
jgi:mannose-1-phosphate guanylyltransferase